MAKQSRVIIAVKLPSTVAAKIEKMSKKANITQAQVIAKAVNALYATARPRKKS